MTRSYDLIAVRYDEHFTRPVDRWEDARLSRLLRPVVKGRNVLDLACGTGYLADITEPASYTGVDASAAMLHRLRVKHPGARTVKADIGEDGWADNLPVHFDVVACTWALQYLGDLDSLLVEARRLARPGGLIALHGYLPRYAGRRHEITGDRAVPVVRPESAVEASVAAGLRRPRIAGTGALPDELAAWRWAWRAALAAPATWHYAALWTWRVPA